MTMILPPNHPLRQKRRPKGPSTCGKFGREILDRLPLVDAALTLFGYAVPPTLLDELFDQHRGRCYQASVTFPGLVRWLFDALVEHQGSGRQAHLQRKRTKGDPCNEAFYGKLRRIPLALSQAFLHGVTNRFLPIRPSTVAHAIPSSLKDLEVVILDGKSLKKVAKRLVETRGTPGKLLGGKLLVAYQPREGLIIDMVADLDGETNEAKLVPDLMPRLHARPGPAKLVVADRLFCALKHFHAFTQDNGHFVTRYARRLSFEADPARPPVRTTDATGRVLVEQWGWAGKASEKLRRYVRWIGVERPGQETITVLTDLLDAAVYPAQDVLDLYRIRWSIEDSFQKVTKIFALGRFIGSTAEATTFQASMCFVLANLTQILQGFAVAKRAEALADVSTHQFAKDWHRQLVALKELVDVGTIVSLIPTQLTADRVVELLEDLMSEVWKPGWTKTRNKKPRPHRHTAKKKGAHTSVQRRRNAAKATSGPNPRCA